MKSKQLVQVLDKQFELFIPFSEIQSRLVGMGSELNREYATLNPVFVPVLNGSFMFASDLIREICIPCEVSFVKTASYEGISSSGKVRELIGIDSQLKGRHLVLLEDIVDTGKTLAALLDTLRNLEPASIRIASLFLKPDAFKEKFEIDFCGFSIPDRFIIGYGLDYNGYGRNYRDVYSLFTSE